MTYLELHNKRERIKLKMFLYLVKFLKENNVTLYEFLKNCKDQNDGVHCCRTFNSGNIEDIYRVIDRSFTWSQTPQKHNFWSELNRKFRLQAQSDCVFQKYVRH